MKFDLEEVLDTISARREDMEGSRQLTNELVVDDLLKELGYNMKKDTTVKRLYNDDRCIDWSLLSWNEKKMAVKVKAINEDIPADEMNETFKYCLGAGFEVILVTSGLENIIYSFKAERNDYAIVAKVDISDMSEQDEEILSAISKKEFDISIINNTSAGYEITTEEVEVIFEKNSARFVDILLDSINANVDNCINAEEKANELIDKVVRSFSETDDAIEKERESFKNQILELTHKNNEFVTTVEILKGQVEDLKAELDRNSGASRQKALELMSIIDDSNTAERSYVAIINDEIIQFKYLHQFVGRILQKLYELKSFEANTYIHNGDIFKLNGIDPKHNDLVINNKAYDVIITNEEEDEAISKLKTIFSHFDGIIFECKKLGNMNAHHNTGLTEEDIETDEERVERLKNDKVIDIGEKVEETTETEEEDEDTGILREDELFNFGEAEANKNNHRILVAQLANIDSLIWSEKAIDFIDVKCIGSNSVTYQITEDGVEMDFCTMTCKCLDAIMAIQEYDGDTQTVLKLKQKKFNLINNFIKEYSEEYKNYPRINGTRYVIVDVEGVQQVAGIVYDVCNALDINMTGIFLYFEADTEEADIIKKYNFDRAAIRIRDTAMYVPDGTYTEGIAVIRGEMFNNIIITKNSLQVFEDVLIKALAVKTKYMAMFINDAKSFPDIAKNMIAEAINNNLNVNIGAVGYLLGEQKMMLSTNQADVGENATALVFDDNTIFCAEVKEWQIVPSLIRLHAVLFNNANIAIKTQINIDAVNFYGSEYETSEPSSSLAIKSFVDYIANCVKNNKA